MFVARVPERSESLIVVEPEQGERGEVTSKDERPTEDGEPEDQRWRRFWGKD